MAHNALPTSVATHPSPGSIASVKRHVPYWRRAKALAFYGFTSPWWVGFLLLILAPLIYALLLSFTNFDGISGRWRWIGLRNYEEVVHTPAILASIAQTLLYVALFVPLSIGGSLALALLLNQRLRAVGVFRTIFYLPSVVPVVASAIMWKLLLARDNGPVNAILGGFRIPAVNWLFDPLAFYSLLIVALWGLGGGMIISLAGLQGVPQELIEAAQIDGAGVWEQFRSITFPLLTPVLFFQVVTGVIFALQTFIQPILLSQASGQEFGNVARGMRLFLVLVYQEIFVNGRFGFGAAMLWVFVLIILVMTLILLGFSRLWVYYEVESSGKETR